MDFNQNGNSCLPKMLHLNLAGPDLSSVDEMNSVHWVEGIKIRKVISPVEGTKLPKSASDC